MVPFRGKADVGCTLIKRARVSESAYGNGNVPCCVRVLPQLLAAMHMACVRLPAPPPPRSKVIFIIRMSCCMIAR